MITIYKGYKVRLYPTKEQEKLMWKHIDACRFIWNYMIDLQQQRYKNGETRLSRFGMCRELTLLKQKEEYSWLNEVSRSSLERTIKDLEDEYQEFFKKNKRYPKYKSSKSKPKFPVRYDVIKFDDKTCRIEKLKYVKVGKNNITAKKFYNPKITLINGKWMLSFCLDYNIETNILTDNYMGIDLGINELAVVAYGNQKLVFHNINKSKRVKTLEHKLNYLNNVITRKYKVNKWKKTKTIIKYERMTQEIRYKLSNIRKNHIHQITNQLIKLLPKRVVMEDLNIVDMMKDSRRGKQVINANWGEFIYQMKYKCARNGIEFVLADRFYPLSKTCSQCGNIKRDLQKSDRVYKCDQCGLEIDRDYNAAINLMRYVSQNERLTT